jgi:hypothetical protein
MAFVVSCEDFKSNEGPGADDIIEELHYWKLEREKEKEEEKEKSR